MIKMVLVTFVWLFLLQEVTNVQLSFASSLSGMNYFDDLSSLLTTEPTFCETEQNKRKALCSAEKNRSVCLYSNEVRFNCRLINQAGLNYIITTNSNDLGNGGNAEPVKVFVDVNENYTIDLQREAQKSTHKFEFILNFGGLNTLHKYSVSAGLVQNLKNFLLKNGYRLVRSSVKKTHLKEYLQNENLRQMRILTLWVQNPSSDY